MLFQSLTEAEEGGSFRLTLLEPEPLGEKFCPPVPAIR